MPAWYPLYTRGEGAAAYRRTLAEMEPEVAPGERVVYSDLNFLLLTDVLETFFGAPLDRLFAELVAGPAGSGARFLPASSRPSSVRGHREGGSLRARDDGGAGV